MRTTIIAVIFLIFLLSPLLITQPTQTVVKGNLLSAFVSKSGLLTPSDLKVLRTDGNSLVTAMQGGIRVLAMTDDNGRKWSSILISALFNGSFTSLQFDVDVTVYGDYQSAGFKVNVIYGNKTRVALDSSAVQYKLMGENTRIYRDTVSIELDEQVSKVYLQVNVTSPANSGGFVKILLSNLKATTVGDAVPSDDHIMVLRGENSEHTIRFYNLTPGTYYLAIYSQYTITSVSGITVKGFKDYVMYRGNYYKLYEVSVDKKNVEIKASSPNAVTKIGIPLLVLVGDVKVEIEALTPLVTYSLCCGGSCSSYAAAASGAFTVRVDKPGVCTLRVNATSDFLLGYREAEFIATDITITYKIENKGSDATVQLWATYAHDRSPFSGQVIALGSNYTYTPGLTLKVKDGDIASLSSFDVTFFDSKYGFAKTVSIPVKHLEFRSDVRDKGILLSFRFTDGSVPQSFRIKVRGTWVGSENGLIMLPPEYSNDVIEDAEVSASDFISDESAVRGASIAAAVEPLLVTAGAVDPIIDPSKPKDISVTLVVLRGGTYTLLLDFGGSKKRLGTYELVGGSTPSIPLTIPPLNTTSPVLIRFIAVDQGGDDHLIGSLLVSPIKPSVEVNTKGNKIIIQTYYEYLDPVTGQKITKPLPNAPLAVEVGGKQMQVKTDSSGVYEMTLDYSTNVKVYYLGREVFNRYINIGTASPVTRTDILTIVILLGALTFYTYASRKIEEKTEREQMKRVERRKELYAKGEERFSWSNIHARWEHYADSTFGSKYLPLTADEALHLAFIEGFYFPAHIEEHIRREIPKNLVEEEAENLYIEKAIPFFLKVLEEVGMKSPNYKVEVKKIHGVDWLIPLRLLKLKSSGGTTTYTMEHQVLVRKGAAIASEAGFDVAIIDSTVLDVHGEKIGAPDAVAVFRNVKVALEAETKTLWSVSPSKRDVVGVLKRAYQLINKLGVYVIIYTLDEEFDATVELLESAIFEAGKIEAEDTPEDAIEKLNSSPLTSEDVAKLFGEKSDLKSVRHLIFTYEEGKGLSLSFLSDPHAIPDSLKESRLIICPVSSLLDWLIVLSEKEVEEAASRKL